MVDKRARILLSNYDDMKNPYYGGGGSYAMHKVARRLSRTYHVMIVTGSYPNAKNETIDGVMYRRIGIARLGARVNQVLFQLLLPLYALKENYDMWIENFTPPFSTSFVPLFTRKPVIGVANLLAAQDMSKKYGGLPFHIIEKLGLRFYRTIVVLTDYINSELKKQFPLHNIYTIPNGVSDTYISYPLHNKVGGYLLYIGRIDIEQKGLDILLDAYASVADTIGTGLVIAGTGPESEVECLNNKIRMLDISDTVHYVGWAEGKKKVALLQDAVCLVLPSRFEEFGMVVLEAFCFGMPVIATDLPKLSWIPQEGVIKVRRGDVHDLADAMVKISHNPALCRSMGKKAKLAVKKYTWEASLRKYEEVVRKTLYGTQ